MTFFVRFCLLCLVSISAIFSCSQESASSSIVVKDAYVRGLPGSVENTSAYMTIINNTDAMMMLSGATTDIAQSVTVHKTENKAGMMNMSNMLTAMIPAHGELVLESGGTHLMLMGLKQPMDFEETISMTLQFENGYEYLISLPVKSVLDE